MTAAGRLAAAGLIPLLLTAGWFALSEGMVAVLWGGVHSHASLWDDGAESLAPEDSVRSRDFVEQALDWDPADPQLLQTAGRIYWWGAWLQRDDPALVQSRVSRSLDYYREAIRRRPAWPAAWLDLAYAKHRQGDWGEEFQRAFARGWDNGSWREPVIRTAVELGLDAWDRLSEANRRILYSALYRAELRDPRWIRRLVKDRGGVFILCLALRDNPPTAGWCREQGYDL